MEALYFLFSFVVNLKMHQDAKQQLTKELDCADNINNHKLIYAYC